jgi:hypothetical protein
MTKTELKPCFVIAPIDKPDSPTRKRSDQIMRHLIRPAAEACCYDASRSDEDSRPGIITSHIVQRLARDPMVVADLTCGNPNVYYDLAIRHLTMKPVVLIIAEGQKPAFDVLSANAIPVNHQDPDKLARAKDELIRQIKYFEHADDTVDNPISLALDSRKLAGAFALIEQTMAGRLIIQAALWGAKRSWEEVTGILDRKIDGDSLRFPATTHDLGDPIHGEHKDLVVVYLDDLAPRWKVVREDGTLDIP